MRISDWSSDVCSSDLLKVALAEEGGADTIIFDEIDRGVGGAVASAIGERLARLAGAGKQLLAVTHSPQVAAKGAAHFVIAKSSEGTVTRTGVRAPDPAGRRRATARHELTRRRDGKKRDGRVR